MTYLANVTVITTRGTPTVLEYRHPQGDARLFKVAIQRAETGILCAMKSIQGRRAGGLWGVVRVLTSVASMPATPAIAKRLCTSSACTYQRLASGSSARPRGSNPLSPARLQERSDRAQWPDTWERILRAHHPLVRYEDDMHQCGKRQRDCTTSDIA